LTQQAGTPLKLDDFPVVYVQGGGPDTGRAGTGKNKRGATGLQNKPGGKNEKGTKGLKKKRRKVTEEEETRRRRKVTEAKHAAASKLMFDWANNLN
jgi:hypothetical protein